MHMLRAHANDLINLHVPKALAALSWQPDKIDKQSANEAADANTRTGAHDNHVVRSGTRYHKPGTNNTPMPFCFCSTRVFSL